MTGSCQISLLFYISLFYSKREFFWFHHNAVCQTAAIMATQPVNCHLIAPYFSPSPLPARWNSCCKCSTPCHRRRRYRCTVAGTRTGTGRPLTASSRTNRSTSARSNPSAGMFGLSTAPKTSLNPQWCKTGEVKLSQVRIS